MMHLIFTHLNPALEDARTLPADKLPRLMADLEEVRCTALARLSAPSQPAPATQDTLLTCKQAAKLLSCSTDTLYRGNFEFTRRLGRKKLYSLRGIEEYLRKQQDR
jgi:hypothetical protein